jgi:hypothetical protein
LDWIIENKINKWESRKSRVDNIGGVGRMFRPFQVIVRTWAWKWASIDIVCRISSECGKWRGWVVKDCWEARTVEIDKID